MNQASNSLRMVPDAPPLLEVRAAAQIARDTYGVGGTVAPLGSNQDLNFIVEAGEGRKLLLKIANPEVSAGQASAQSRAAHHVSTRVVGLRVPTTLETLGGELVAQVEVAGTNVRARLLEFLDGETFSGNAYLAAPVIEAFGALAATVDRALEGFAEAGVERGGQWDLRTGVRTLADLLPFVADPGLRTRIARVAELAAELIAPLAGELPEQVIHGDLTDDNILWSDPVSRRPDGIIDFGDLTTSWTVSEIAITVSSLLHHAGVGIADAMTAVRAYHAIRPLSEAEAEALWPLVVLRAGVLVASAHHVLHERPDNDYARENLAHELAILDAATSVPLPVGSALVRAAVGLPATQPNVSGLGRLIDIGGQDVCVLDLSASSPLLDRGRWLEVGIEDSLMSAALETADVVMTSFAQPRLTRSRPAAPGEPANVILGIQLRSRLDLEVRAPADAKVVGTERGVIFELEELQVAVMGGAAVTTSPVRAGQPAARIPAGRTAMIQVVKRGIEAPTTVTPSLAAAWHAVVVDPSFLIFDAARGGVTSDPAELLARRDRSFARVQEHYYAAPPEIVRGWREFLVDRDGRVYLDAVNNVTSIGHAHPRLSDALYAQWNLLNTNSRFHYESVVEFSERLAATMPDELDTVFLVNSGSEAVDLALRLARIATGHSEIVAMREAYHGWTDLADAVSTSIADNPRALESRPAWLHTVEAANSFRGRLRGQDAVDYAPAAVALIDELARAGRPAAAFIAETFYGNAGGIALPPGYLDRVYAAVRRHGGLAVADEVQVGYGRLGEWFWGFEQQQVVPDIVAVAKAMGNGHPLGAVVTSRHVADAFRASGYFFSSAGGSPVSSVVGLTVLDIIRDERLQQNARDVGNHLLRRLRQLQDTHGIIGAVHGSGLYLGIELVRDRSTLEAASAECMMVCERMLRLGIIVQPTGDRGTVLKLKPPMCLTIESADAFVDALDTALTTGW